MFLHILEFSKCCVAKEKKKKKKGKKELEALSTNPVLLLSNISTILNAVIGLVGAGQSSYMQTNLWFYSLIFVSNGIT